MALAKYLVLWVSLILPGITPGYRYKEWHYRDWNDV